jgi:hypothetical protein
MAVGKICGACLRLPTREVGETKDQLQPLHLCSDFGTFGHLHEPPSLTSFHITVVPSGSVNALHHCNSAEMRSCSILATSAGLVAAAHAASSRLYHLHSPIRHSLTPSCLEAHTKLLECRSEQELQDGHLAGPNASRTTTSSRSSQQLI